LILIHLKRERGACILVLTLILSLLSITGAQTQEPGPDLSKLSPQQTIDLILSQMAKKQKETQTIQAEFSMEKKTALMASPVHAEGILCISKPDKIYWEVKDPIANSIILNGNTLWIYFPTLRQVDKVDISGKRKTVMRFLEMNAEGGVFKEHYRIQLRSGPEEKEALQLELIPKSARFSRRINRIKVWVDTRAWFPSRLDFWEPNGDYSSVRLKNVQINGSIPLSLYDFKPPPGTAINEPLKMGPSRSER
jgi:outer membrane lipoprotein carrier protein